MLSPEDAKIFIEHLNKTMKGGQLDPCPVCGALPWSVDRIVGQMEMRLGAGGNAELGPESMPMVVMHCTKCFYVRQFLWLPIKAAHGG